MKIRDKERESKRLCIKRICSACASLSTNETYIYIFTTRQSSISSLPSPPLFPLPIEHKHSSLRLIVNSYNHSAIKNKKTQLSYLGKECRFQPSYRILNSVTKPSYLYYITIWSLSKQNILHTCSYSLGQNKNNYGNSCITKSICFIRHIC